MTKSEFLAKWKAKYPNPSSIIENAEDFFYEARQSTYTRVNCPYCRKRGFSADTKHHCHVHYEQEWFKCHRCGAGGSLRFLLGVYSSKDSESKKSPPVIRKQDTPKRKFKIKPGGCIPITSLPPDHIALQYLLSEGFSMEELKRITETYRTFYCFQGIELSGGSTTHRIIFEIEESNEVIGWQARWLPKQWPPSEEDLLNQEKEKKYLLSPGFRKSQSFYNWDIAQNWDVFVLVEGVKKVWKTGPWALGTFGIGNSVKVSDLLPSEEKNKFWSERLKLAQRPVLILYDKDGFSTALSHEKGLRELGVDATAIPLPKDGPKDLDDYHKIEIRKILLQTLGRLPKPIKK